MSARSEPACSAIASPMGSFTERPVQVLHLPCRWAGSDQAGTAIPAACPNHVQIDSTAAVASGGPGQTSSTTAGRTSWGAWRQPRMKSRRSSSPWNVAPRREATCSTTPLRGRRSSFSSPAAGVQTRTRKVCMRSWCGAGLSVALRCPEGAPIRRGRWAAGGSPTGMALARPPARPSSGRRAGSDGVPRRGGRPPPAWPPAPGGPPRRRRRAPAP
jgi:hypothetical protein